MDRLKIDVPRWVMWLYGALAVALIPWTFDLASNLPVRHLVRHWDALWVGFDCLIVLAVLLTVWLMSKHRIWMVIPATSLATLFLVDVWFDNLTAKPGREQRASLAFGVLETTLALMTYYLVFHIIRQSGAQKDIQLGTKRQS